MAGAWDLGTPNFFKVPARVCNLSRNARGFRLPRGMALVPDEEGGGARGLGPRLANPGRQAGIPTTFRRAEVPSESRRRVR